MNSIKNILLIFILISISACDESKNKQVLQYSQFKGLDFISFNDSIYNDGTNLPIEPIRNFVAPFVLDSLSYEDTAIQYSVSLYFSVSRDPNDSILNRLILKRIMRSAMNEAPTIEYASQGFLGLGSQFSLWITSFDIDTNLVRLCFKEQSYHDGAAHFNYGYTTFNFDRTQQEEIKTVAKLSRELSFSHFIRFHLDFCAKF